MFNVGNIVKCVDPIPDSLVLDGKYTVVSCDSMMVTVYDGTNTSGPWLLERFELSQEIDWLAINKEFA